MVRVFFVKRFHGFEFIFLFFRVFLSYFRYKLRLRENSKREILSKTNCMAGYQFFILHLLT